MVSQARVSTDDLLARLRSSPDVYPQAIDLVRQMVLLIEFDAAACRAASFLDDRILGPTTRGAWVPIAAVAQSAPPAAAQALHFIFHTGHVGSTLVSRLLDETGVVRPLREPLPLRTLAEAHDVLSRPESLLAPEQFDALLALFVRLWARGPAGTQAAVLKSTSSAGRLAPLLLACSERSRAIYLNLRAEPYLATLLAGPNSPLDLRAHGPGRIRRLQARLAQPLPALHTLSLGELAAMSWLVESWSQHDALQSSAGRVLAVDFDQLLAGVDEVMARVIRHLGLEPAAAATTPLSRSAVLTRYSKAPEHPYSPSLRHQVLDEARHEHRGEMRRGLAWLERLAGQQPAVAEVVTRLG